MRSNGSRTAVSSAAAAMRPAKAARRGAGRRRRGRGGRDGRAEAAHRRRRSGSEADERRAAKAVTVGTAAAVRSTLSPAEAPSTAATAAGSSSRDSWQNEEFQFSIQNQNPSYKPPLTPGAQAVLPCVVEQGRTRLHTKTHALAGAGLDSGRGTPFQNFGSTADVWRLHPTRVAPPPHARACAPPPRCTRARDVARPAPLLLPLLARCGWIKLG